MIEKTGKIEITLLSDLLVSYGNGYNSMIDQDVCYDKYGFPLIPAKRIKGCLREVAMELMDWGYDTIFVNVLFGGAGEQEGKVQISNAYLKNYETYVKELHQTEKCLRNPQMVLEQFTYTRTQTAIHYKTGVAEEGLRVSRVIGKGVTFEAPVMIRGNTKEEIEKYERELEICCKAFRRMGCERTRGFGEISANFTVGEVVVNASNENISLNGNAKYRLNYKIYLNSAMIVKSEAGGLERAQDYLPGAMMLGKIAGWIKEEGNSYEDFMKEGEVICSNAYICLEHKRMLPIPASLFVVKNEEEKAIDLTCLKEEKSDVPYQMKSPGACYIDGNLEKEGTEKLQYKKRKVLLEINYHHSRPKDKSIGRVLQNDTESQLYQLGSICAGQEFSGYIIGNGVQIEKIDSFLKNHKKCRMGYNRTAEYGEVTITVDEPEQLMTYQAQQESQFVLKLESPLMEYDEQGRYTTDIQVLTSELEEILGKKIKPIRTFYRYQSTGGYNRSWHMRKPTIDVWDKGTTIVYEVEGNQTVNINCLKDCFLGERIKEGYGEISVYPVSNERNKTITEGKDVEEQTLNMKESQFREKLKHALAEKFVQGEARKQAKDDKLIEDPALIHCMISMCRENQSDDLKQYLTQTIEGRYGDSSNERKKDKKNLAKIILTRFDMDALKEKFQEEYGIALTIDEKCVASWYYPVYLTELKYMCRSQKEKGGK